MPCGRKLFARFIYYMIEIVLRSFLSVDVILISKDDAVAIWTSHYSIPYRSQQLYVQIMHIVSFIADWQQKRTKWYCLNNLLKPQRIH